MKGLLVKIRGSRRYWRVTADNGRTLSLRWGSERRRRVPRSDVVARYESGVGWVETAIPAKR